MSIVRVFGKVHRGWSLSLADQLLSGDPIWPGDELIGNWPAGNFGVDLTHQVGESFITHVNQAHSHTHHSDAFILLCINLYSWRSINLGHHVFPIILHELPIKCEKDISSVTCGNYAARLEALSHRTYTKICKTGIAKKIYLSTCHMLTWRQHATSL